MTQFLNHSSNGDNVAGNKFEEHNYFSGDSINNSINSKLREMESCSKMDLSDNIALKAFKEFICEVIEKEQAKSHNIVPIAQLRDKFQNYIEEDFFVQIMKDMNNEKRIQVNKIQVCYVSKDLTYSIDL